MGLFFQSRKSTGYNTVDMGFKVISKHYGDRMYAGQIIEYKIRPVFNISLYWMTEITQVKDKEYLLMSNVLVHISYGIISIILRRLKAALK